MQTNDQLVVQVRHFQQYPEGNKLDFNAVCMQIIISSEKQDLFLRVSEAHSFFEATELLILRPNLVNVGAGKIMKRCCNNPVAG
jgi:hypothetical protein